LFQNIYFFTSNHLPHGGSMTSKVLAHARELIGRRSVTPADAGCQSWLAQRLADLGFAHRTGQQRRGHQPVGAPGDIPPPSSASPATPTWCPPDRWNSGPAIPFSPVERDGRLYGRGAADMKGSIAAFLAAVEDFLADHPGHAGSIAWLITSDEEGPAVDGTVKVVERLRPATSASTPASSANPPASPASATP
jgi:succinyl-diaminopimelate desuccinylase